ncbi:MFS transporter [Halomonas organivorans]|uniref:MFS family permease n=1 Tax=Halomonas organivorans TaxID=257772 RepID=A0A7W5BZA1_9GAMM|nr:MFS transporter [Halomonas organivorans]MBB3141926.1 MFS family permease [Halomonas organivorans]
MLETNTTPAASRSAFKTFCVSGIGTALEFYDFVIYGIAAALVFPQLFFPDLDQLTGTLIAFGAFGAGFFVRPLGGVICGHFGDKIGRQKVLVLTLVLMGLCTFLIGCLPTHASLGIWAPALLVLLRLVQGFAAGGEWGGAALFGIESAPAGRRGLWGSFTSMGIGIGGIFASSIFAITSAAADGDLVSFAWRIPFWLGGLLLLVGLYARLRSTPDTPPAHSEATHSMPLLDALRFNPRSMMLCTLIAFGYVTIAYIGSTFFLSYANQIGYGSTQALMFDLTLSITIVLSAPLFGHCSDRFGRRRVMILGALCMAIGMFFFFPLVGMKSLVVSLGAYALIGLLMGMTQGPIPALLGEQFPRHMRYSGISASYQVGAAIGGGTASSAATGLLILTDQNPLGVSAYGAAAMALVAICSYLLKETAHKNMAEIDRGVHSSLASPRVAEARA